MSLGYDISTTSGCCISVGKGEITQHQRMSVMLAWLREPKYEDCGDALIDLAGVKTTPKVIELCELIAMLKR
jgi:hypothetical protein